MHPNPALVATFVLLLALPLYGDPANRSSNASTGPAQIDVDRTLVQALWSLDLTPLDLRLLNGDYLFHSMGFAPEARVRIEQRISQALANARQQTPDPQILPGQVAAGQARSALRHHAEMLQRASERELQKESQQFINQDLSAAGQLRLRQVWVQFVGPNPSILEALGLDPAARQPVLRALIASNQSAMKAGSDAAVLQAGAVGTHKVMTEMLNENQKGLWQRMIGKEVSLTPAPPEGRNSP